MKVLFRLLFVLCLTLPLAGCSGEVGSGNVNQETPIPEGEGMPSEHAEVDPDAEGEDTAPAPEPGTE